MNHHILVVDDEPPVRDLLQTYFKKHRFTVTAASTAEETLALLPKVAPNLVVLDVLLPDSDGLDLLQQIRAAHPRIPVIIMTGIGYDEELLQEALQKGAFGYFSKTLPLDQILAQVRRALETHSNP